MTEALDLDRIVEDAAAAVAAGRVVGVPTETVYGLAVDPRDVDAVERLITLKGRRPDKPIALLGVGVASFARLARMDPLVTTMAARHWPGPLTFVVPARGRLVPGVGDAERRTIGVRVPDHPITLALLERTGPLAVTSANRSGEPEALDDVAARRLFGEDVACYLPGGAAAGQGSTVVDMTTEPPTVLRQGPVRLRF